MVEACAIYQSGWEGAPKAITNFRTRNSATSHPQILDQRASGVQGLSRRGIICAIYLKILRRRWSAAINACSAFSRQPDWSPDGNRIAVASHCGTPQNEEIWVVDTDGDGLRQLTHNGNDYFNGPHDFQPSWSPEGDAIVFVAPSPYKIFSSHAIYMMRFDGTGCRKLFELPGRPARILASESASRPCGERHRPAAT